MNKKLKKGQYLEIILRSPQTIFTTKDIALLWSEDKERTIISRLNKYCSAGKLKRLRRGIYAKDDNYDPFELATRIYTPSYISFETVLTRSGINFQYYESIFAASYVTREITVQNQKISFIRINRDILSNPAGIENNGKYSIASKERAFLDRIYISKNYYFDHLGAIDFNKVFEILPIYQNKNMAKRVQGYYKDYKNNQ